MESEIDYWIEEPAGVEGDDTFRPGLRETIVRLMLLALLLSVLTSMVLPRQTLILEMDLPPNPPVVPIEPNFWR